MPANIPLLVSGGYDPCVCIWSADRGERIDDVLFKDSHVNTIANADSNLLAVGGNPLVKLYDIQQQTHSPLATYEGHSSNVTSVGFSDALWFFSASEDETVKVWDKRSSTGQLFFRTGSAVSDALLHPLLPFLIFVAGRNGHIHVWDIRTNSTSRRLRLRSSISSISISPDGRTLAAATHNGLLHLWKLKGFEVTEPMKPIDAHNGNYVLRCRFSPHSELLATASSDRTCSIWRHHTDGFSKELTVSGHSKWVWDCVFSRDSAYIVTAGSDALAHLWDSTTGQHVLSYKGHHRAITCVLLLD